MRAFIIFMLVVLTNFNFIEGGYKGNCHIQGFSSNDWYYGITIDKPIGDSFDGVIFNYKMEKTREMVSYKSNYMNATFVDGNITVFTNENFKKFEEEYDGGLWYTPSMSIEMTFICEDNKTETLEIEQEVTDDNTHDPVFNRAVYEYSFGMTIPADFDLSQVIPMTASDKDFLNTRVYFTMDYSDDVIIKYETDDYYNWKIYTTSFKTLKELRAPFKKELMMYTVDNGTPTRNSTAKVIISVTSNGNDGNGGNDDNGNGSEESNENGSDENNGSGVHPPVFAKHLYFANYTSSHDLKMEETITIKYGAEVDTIIKQSGYDEYFKIALNPKIKGALEVTNLQTLPDTIIASTSFLLIEIEAENKNLHMPGRTALVINLPAINQDNAPAQCGGVADIFGYSNHSSISLIFFLTAIFMILIMNIVILIWFFQKKKLETDVIRVQYPVSPTSDITRIEKIKI